jgi:hypothetical protein
MRNVPKLEIIGADGIISFHALDPRRGVANIGSHPENDVVIPSPDVEPFCAIVDFRQEPYSLIVLPGSLPGNSRVLVNGQLAAPSSSTSLRPWDTLSIGGVTIVVLVESVEEARRGNEAAMGAAMAGAAVLPRGDAPSANGNGYAPSSNGASANGANGASAAGAAAPESVSRIKARPIDVLDDIVMAQMAEREWMIDAGQTTQTQIVVTNGGPLVGVFNISIEGLEPAWVEINPPSVNLNDGDRAMFSFLIDPPRLPATRAGQYHFSVIITSPDYPSHFTRLGATLTINPFYDYAVGELSPRQQTIGYLKKTGMTTVSLLNRGNSAVKYRIDAEDEERKCTFEFEVPGENMRQAKQAEVLVRPEELLVLPVLVTPMGRRIVATRARQLMVTLTANPLEGQQSPRSVLGQVKSTPLIGPWVILLVALITAIAIILIFRPRLETFTADQNVIEAGSLTHLRWAASSFTELRIDPEVGTLQTSAGSIVISPTVNTTYRLSGENFLSRLLPPLKPADKTIQIAVAPVFPKIGRFASDRPAVVAGQSATIFWEVTNADSVILLTNGAPESIPREQFIGSRVVNPAQDTQYVLQATNPFRTESSNFTIRVLQPTPTPSPTPVPPVILRFDVEPKVITAGQQVRIDWEVTGVNEVRISNVTPGDSPLPAKGSINVTPQENTLFVLSAGVGDAAIRQQWEVQVSPAPGPTPTPRTPAIEFFTISPVQVVRGSPQANAVIIAWSVFTPTTNIQISSPDLASPLSNLPAQGSITVQATKPTLYILTAFNGELKASQTVNLAVLEPTPTLPPPPTATPAPPTPTPLPEPVVVFFGAVQSDGQTNNLTFAGSSMRPDGAAQQNYLIRFGTNILLNWDTLNATQVNITGVGAGPAQGNSPPLRVSGPQVYELQATNAQGVTRRAYVQITLLDVASPPAPFGVGGSETGSVVNVTWNYSAADQANITSFRIFRSASGSEDLGQLVAEITDTKLRTWTDPQPAQCGQSYRVTAVYLNTFGVPTDTGVGVPTFATQPCATPSP